MLGFVLGTSEGRWLLSKFNEYTDDIFVSAFSKYGKSIYSEYKYKKINAKPLDVDGFIDVIKENKIDIFIDASHPFAKEVTKNLKNACEKAGISYYRYERPGVYDKYTNEPLVFGIDNYKDIVNALEGIKGTVLNTTGSNNVKVMMNLGIENKIIHRVMPIADVIQKLNDSGVNASEIIAIKMDGNARELNEAFIKAYDVKALITKDSGEVGGTKEKIETCIACGIRCIVIKKNDISEEVYSDLNLLFDDVLREMNEKIY